MGSEVFSEDPRALKRLVLLLYAAVGPIFTMVLFFQSLPGLRMPATEVVAGLIAAGAFWLWFTSLPGPYTWLFSIVLSPMACCGIAFVACGASGPAYLGVLMAPLAWAAGLCDLRVVRLAWGAGVATCLVVLWSTGPLVALGNTLVFGTISGLVAWVTYSKVSRFRAVLKVLPDAMARMDEQGRFLEVIGEQVLPHARQTYVGHDVAEFVDPNAVAKLKAAVTRALETAQVQVVEYATAAPVRHIRSRVVKARPNEVVVIRQDVTAEHLAVKSIEASEQRFRALANSAPVLIWVSDLTKGCVWFNAQWLAFTGRTLEQEHGNGWAEGVHPDDLARCVEHYEVNFDRRAEFSMEYRLRRADGEFRWILDRGAPRFDEQGQFIGYIGSCIDITDRKLIEERVAAASLSVRTIIEASLDPLVTISAQATITDVNRATELATGLRRSALIGSDFSSLFTEAARGREACEEVFREGLLIDYPLALKHVDGHSTPVLYNATVYSAPNGHVEGLFAARDVSARQRIEEQLEQATKAAQAASELKSRFLANMSHEIRTPLNAVLGLSRLALDGDGAGEQLPEYLRMINGAASGLLGLVNDILDLSKIEAGRLTIEKSPFSLPRLLDELRQTMNFTADANGVRLAFDVDVGLQGLEGDALRLRQVLTNLLSNAIKFSPGGDVTLKVRAVHDAIVFQVTDTGIGMTDEQQRGLFQPFAQADDSTTRRFGGTGLGLSISRQLATLMGGDLTATSALDRGSTFTFRVPLKASVALLPSASVDALPPVDLHGLRVLLVEDNQINQLLARRVLERAHATVTLAVDGRDAVDLLAQSPDAFDAVLMDVQMPRLDGLEATRLIRGQLRLGELPIIAMTAHAMAEERARSLAAGMNAHLTKPINIQELYATLGAVVRRAA